MKIDHSEYRKVQELRTGNKHLIVSIPKIFVAQMGLKKGDYIKFTPKNFYKFLIFEKVD